MTTQSDRSLVSVIIPAYNAERYLLECVNSVLAQTESSIQCIVVDDGSKDGTARVMEKVGDAVEYVYQENAERSVARNNGLRHATGEFVGFLDADDYLAPEKIAEQLQFLREHPECDVVYSKVRFFKEGGSTRSFSSPKRITPCGDLLEPLLYGNFIAMHSPLIRRSAIDLAGGFDPALSHNEDWEFLLRLSLSGARFGFMDDFHAFCRLHAENTSSDSLKMYESKWKVAEQFVKAHAEELAARMIDSERVLCHHQADYGKALILHGFVREGRRLVAEACRRPIPKRNALLLLSFSSGILGSPLMRALDSATHRIRKWTK